MQKNESGKGSQSVVVLLHGLGRTHRSLGALGKFVESLGFEVWSRSYPSRRKNLEQLADFLCNQISVEVGERPLIAVTHSMGGILARLLDQRLHWEKIFMMAPPNQGSEVAARLSANAWFRSLLGPAATELGQKLEWPMPNAPCTIVAGTAGATLGNIPSWLVAARHLPKHIPSDGTVSVDETKLPNMAAFHMVLSGHTQIMNSPRTRELLRSFLQAK